MTSDEEKACKAICNSTSCKTICTKCKCYLAGLKAGREENAGLKEIASRSGYRIAELKHEVDELKTLHEGDQRVIEAIMMQWKAETNELKAHCKDTDEWHNLKKNPDDLPKNKGMYWAKFPNGYDKIYYDPGSEVWPRAWVALMVIAWHELPKLEE